MSWSLLSSVSAFGAQYKCNLEDVKVLGDWVALSLSRPARVLWVVEGPNKSQPARVLLHYSLQRAEWGTFRLFQGLDGCHRAPLCILHSVNYTAELCVSRSSMLLRVWTETGASAQTVFMPHVSDVSGKQRICLTALNGYACADAREAAS
ncbi:hypothetical protein BR93DRAFT_807092 [Coniochaeta sp. PMI_546]|nr:hypothetical protein BR93DRAFT_807092 [Coniochaeta sp. PMI_546]